MARIPPRHLESCQRTVGNPARVSGHGRWYNYLLDRSSEILLLKCRLLANLNDPRVLATIDYMMQRK